MRSPARFIASVALLAGGASLAAKDGGSNASDVIDATRNTKATFAVISDVYVAFEGLDPQTFRGAEFHSGANHRIEDAKNRVVANCVTREGHWHSFLLSKRTSGGTIADDACGIGGFPSGSAVRYIGPVKYGFGAASRIEVDDGKFLRTYDVLPNGAIVRNLWLEKAKGAKIVYRSDVQSYCERELPADMFTEASLDRTYIENVCQP